MVDSKHVVLPEAPPPPVVIEELSTEQEVMDDPQEGKTPIVVQPGRGELEFRYAALSYRAVEENRYRYKLDGVDHDWVEARGRQTAHYNNIYPGKYMFHVVACNCDGVWNKTGASLAVVMMPHLWQRWWFRPAILAVAITGLAILFRIIVLRRREIEYLRMRIAADLHDEIGSNLASIALLSQLGQKNQDKVAAPELSEINRIALVTVNAIREIVWFINPEHDTMPEMVVRMNDVAAQLLMGISYTFNDSTSQRSGKLSPEFRRNLFLIFKEVLHNIVKHSRATQVEIALRESHSMLHLRIIDNGKGFDPAAVSRGNGLKNIRLRAGQLGGTVNIAPSATTGTVVDVVVVIT